MKFQKVGTSVTNEIETRNNFISYSYNVSLMEGDVYSNPMIHNCMATSIQQTRVYLLQLGIIGSNIGCVYLYLVRNRRAGKSG